MFPMHANAATITPGALSKRLVTEKTTTITSAMDIASFVLSPFSPRADS